MAERPLTESAGEVYNRAGYRARRRNVEEHELGARIILERGGDIAPFAITCGIYGWMAHTRFFGIEAEAAAEFERMKDGLAAILGIIPRKDDPEADAKGRLVSEAISAFVERFP
jgi:hypothetical protein